MTPPSVSLIVPCYRYASVLEGCVSSILEQEGVELRVLIIDDCSPDETPDVAQRLVDRDPRVAYRRHAQNMGLIATANEGLAWADGEYVVLISADDVLVPGALRRATAVMEANPSVGMVYGRAPYWYVGQPPPRYGRRWRGTQIWSGADWIRMRCCSGYNCISSPEVVVRNAVQRAVGGYDPSCYHTSDLNMWLRIAAVSDVAYVRGAAQAIYRVNPAGMLRRETAHMADLYSRRDAFDSFFASSGHLLPDAERLRATAGRALARQSLWRASRAFDRGITEGPGARPVDELIAFALEVYPAARRLREWWGLEVRRRLGSGRSLLFLPFIATGVGHRLRGHLRHLRWKARGI